MLHGPDFACILQTFIEGTFCNTYIIIKEQFLYRIMTHGPVGCYNASVMYNSLISLVDLQAFTWRS